MTIKKVLSLLIFMILIHSQVYSQSMTGMDLLRGCSSVIKQAEGKQLSAEESIEMFYWLGYISGFNESTIITHVETQNPPYCAPKEGVETEQLVLIVHKYLKEHPDILHETARICILLALKDAFPYKQ